MQLALTFLTCMGIVGITRSTAKDHEEHGVNSNGTVNTAVEYVLIIAPLILIVREVKDMYLVIQNMQYLDPMVSFCSTISSTNRRPKTCQKVVDCGVEGIV